jgi:hypothetical protein
MPVGVSSNSAHRNFSKSGLYLILKCSVNCWTRVVSASWSEKVVEQEHVVDVEANDDHAIGVGLEVQTWGRLTLSESQSL